MSITIIALSAVLNYGAIELVATWIPAATVSVCFTELCPEYTAVTCTQSGQLKKVYSMRWECVRQVGCYDLAGSYVDCGTVELDVTTNQLDGWVFGDDFDSGTLDHWSVVDVQGAKE